MAKDQFHEFLIDQLRILFSAENMLIKALPKMAESALDEDLIEAFRKHLTETKNQVARLQKIFRKLNENPEGKNSEVMASLIKEGEEFINRFPKSALRDAALITAAQRVEHYEIAVYGAVRTFANDLDMDEEVELLQESLDEEGNANKKLTEIAQGGMLTTGVNKKAEKNA